MVEGHVNGIYYKKIGEGRPVIFLHGWVVGSNFFEYQMKELSKNGYSSIAFDLPGHGKSISLDDYVKKNGIVEDDREEHEVLLDVIKSVFKSVLNKCKVRPPYVLVGHSLGSVIAMYLGAIHNGDVAAMVLINPAYKFPENSILNSYELAQPLLSLAEPFKGAISVVFSPLISLFLKKPVGFSKTLIKQVLTAGSTTAKKEFNSIKNLDLRVSVNRTNVLKNIKVPVLIIGGSYDIIVPVSYSRDLEKMLNANIRILRGGHGLALEKTKEVNKIILKFLKDKA